MKKIISLLLAVLTVCSLAAVLGGCGSSALVVKYNGEKKSYSVADLKALGTQTQTVTWLDKDGKTGSETFTGIYFSNLFAKDEFQGLARTTYTVKDSKGNKHNEEKMLNGSSLVALSAFIAINKDNTLSLVYPQTSMDMVNKEMWVDNVKEVFVDVQKIALTISVNDEIKYYSLDELKDFDQTTQEYAWTDIDGTSGKTKLTGVTFRDLGLKIPANDYMMVTEDSTGVEYNTQIDYSFYVERIANYCDLELKPTATYDKIAEKMKKAKTKIPEPMIAIMKNDSLLLPTPQISGDYNKDAWVYNIVSLSLEKASD